MLVACFCGAFNISGADACEINIDLAIFRFGLLDVGMEMEVIVRSDWTDLVVNQR